MKLARILNSLRAALQKELQMLFQTNGTSPYLQILCEGFDECLTIKRAFPRNIGAQIKSGLIKNNIPLYSEDSAAVYVSMLSDIGNIIKVSKNFSEILPIVTSN